MACRSCDFKNSTACANKGFKTTYFSMFSNVSTIIIISLFNVYILKFQSFEIIDGIVDKIGKTLELPEHLFYFVQSAGTGEKVVGHFMRANILLALQIVDVRKVFRKSFRSSLQKIIAHNGKICFKLRIFYNRD